MVGNDSSDLRGSSSRLHRLPLRDLINGTADDLEIALTDLTEEIEKEWSEEWQTEKRN